MTAMITLNMVDSNIVRHIQPHFLQAMSRRVRLTCGKKALPDAMKAFDLAFMFYGRRFKDRVSSCLGQGASVFSCTPPLISYSLQAIALFNAINSRSDVTHPIN